MSRTSAASRTSPATISCCAIRRRATRSTARRCSNEARRDRGGGARLARHALSAPGGDAGRGLRLPRAAARRVADAVRRRAVAVPPYRADWRDARHADELLAAAERLLVPAAATLAAGQVVLFRLGPTAAAASIAASWSRRTASSMRRRGSAWSRPTSPMAGGGASPARYDFLESTTLDGDACAFARRPGGRRRVRRADRRDASAGRSARSPAAPSTTRCSATSRQPAAPAARYPAAGLERGRADPAALWLEPAQRQHHLGDASSSRSTQQSAAPRATAQPSDERRADDRRQFRRRRSARARWRGSGRDLGRWPAARHRRG